MEVLVKPWSVVEAVEHVGCIVLKRHILVCFFLYISRLEESQSSTISSKENCFVTILGGINTYHINKKNNKLQEEPQPAILADLEVNCRWVSIEDVGREERREGPSHEQRDSSRHDLMALQLWG